MLFNLYNEPHNVGWDIWLKGGQVTEAQPGRPRSRRTEPSACKLCWMQYVRTGAKNVDRCRRSRLAYDYSGILQGRQLADPEGNGVLYDNHAYPTKGDTVERWITKMETAAKTLPVIVGEFGAEARGTRAKRKSNGSGTSFKPWRTTAGAGRPGTCTPAPARG